MSLCSLTDPISPGLLWYPVTFVMYDDQNAMKSMCQHTLQACLAELPPSLLADPMLEDMFQLEVVQEAPASALPSEDEADSIYDGECDVDDDEDGGEDDDETDQAEGDEEGSEDVIDVDDEILIE